jgi:hypothetical protein
MVAVGGVSLLAPEVVVRLSGAPAGDAAKRTVQVLGARQLIQATALILHPTKAMRTGGVLVDAAHAASMLALAGLDLRARRAALASAVLATVFAVASAADH